MAIENTYIAEYLHESQLQQGYISLDALQIRNCRIPPDSMLPCHIVTPWRRSEGNISRAGIPGVNLKEERSTHWR